MGVRAGEIGRRLLAGMTAAVLAGVAACSGAGGGPTTYPVKGTVVSPGGKPWTGGTISFRSVSDPSILATGEIGNDGGFTLATHYLVEGQPRTRPGAVAGEHNVTVEESGGPVDRDGVSTIPPITLRKTFQVEAGENTLVVEVPRPARR